MKVITETTPELVEYLENVEEWGSGGLIMTPFLIYYAAIAMGPEAYKYDPDYAVSYAFWYGDRGEGAIAACDKKLVCSQMNSLMENPEYIKRKYEDWRVNVGLFNQFMDEHRDQVLSDQLYEEFEVLYLKEYATAVYNEFFVFCDSLLDDLLAKYGVELVHKAIEPRGETFMAGYQQALLRCAIEREGSEAVDRVVENWHWILNNYRDTDLLSFEVVKKEVTTLTNKYSVNELKQQLVAKKKQVKAQREELEQINKKLNVDEWELVSMFALSALWMDQRKKANLRADSFINEYLEVKAKELNITLNDIQWLVPDELKLILKGERRVADYPLKKRQDNSVGLAHNTWGLYFLSDSEARKLDKYYPDRVVQSRDDKKITGQVASPGVVRGMVRVVTDPSRSDSFNDGDILVAYMTRPDYVPLMKKAGAIVTNEGGITSHAAIVSRELGIPCVIGTKIATQVLKDGDMVEVDADKGIVRKV